MINYPGGKGELLSPGALSRALHQNDDFSVRGEDAAHPASGLETQSTPETAKAPARQSLRFDYGEGKFGLGVDGGLDVHRDSINFDFQGPPSARRFTGAQQRDRIVYQPSLLTGYRDRPLAINTDQWEPTLETSDTGSGRAVNFRNRQAAAAQPETSATEPAAPAAPVKKRGRPRKS